MSISNKTQLESLERYNWDSHFATLDELRRLDIYALELSGARPRKKGKAIKFLIDEFAEAADGGMVCERSELCEALSSAVRRAATTANRCVSLLACHAQRTVDYVGDIVTWFPEERWSKFVDREIKERGKKIEELSQIVKALGPLYNSRGIEYHNDVVWGAALDAIKLSTEEYTKIKPPTEKSALDEGDRLSFFIDAQSQFANETRECAWSLKELIDECLRLSTTIEVVPDSIVELEAESLEKLKERQRDFSCVANELVVFTGFSLQEAGAMQNAAQLSLETRRPIFMPAAP